MSYILSKHWWNGVCKTDKFDTVEELLECIKMNDRTWKNGYWTLEKVGE